MQRQSCARPRRAAASAAIFICVLAALASPGAGADEVHGVVKLGPEVARDRALEFRREGSAGGMIQIRTDRDGNYRVFLAPGRYEVRLGAPEPTRWLIVQSLPASVRQNLEFPPAH